MSDLRCDLCNQRTQIDWTYLTPNRAKSRGEAELRDVPWFEDPEWAVCGDCHHIIQCGALDQLIARSVILQEGQMIALGNPVDVESFKLVLRTEIQGIHTVFWTHVERDSPREEPGYRIPKEEGANA